MKKYAKSDIDALDIALKFYHTYFEEYYHLICAGLSKEDIIISPTAPGSYTLPGVNKSYVKTNGTEKDILVIIHEMAHYCDVCSHPHIIEYHRVVYSEVVPFYIERIFESEMKEEYQRVISARKVNRNTTAGDCLELALLMLKYEDYYNAHGNIDDIIDDKEMKKIMSRDSNNLVNHLIRYPLATLYSAYMLSHGIDLHGKLNTTLDVLDFNDIINDRKVKELVLHEM